MEYQEIHPDSTLQQHIHSFWELKGADSAGSWERIFPDGCLGLVTNVGDDCVTDNGLITMEHGETYVVGAMTTFKDSLIGASTHLVGVCLKPASFSSFFSFASQSELKNQTIRFEKRHALDVKKLLSPDSAAYLNRYFIERFDERDAVIIGIARDIVSTNGLLSISELAKKHRLSTRQMERKFNGSVGLTPKEFSAIVRFQRALKMVQHQQKSEILLDIALNCGYYDHAHFTREFRKATGISPSEL